MLQPFKTVMVQKEIHLQYEKDVFFTRLLLEVVIYTQIKFNTNEVLSW